MEGSEGLGAIFPADGLHPHRASRALGYPDDHPKVVEAHRHLKDLFIQEGDTIRIQPCFSPVWDTGIALHALAEAGLSPDADVAKSTTDGSSNKECRKASDWAKNCPGVEPSGWFFEFANPHYPDVDDTAMVVMALRRMGGEVAEPAIRRGLNWLLAMQNDDGGWAAFDRTKDRWILEHVPFADHNAMQDPSCPDITGRVLECLRPLRASPRSTRPSSAPSTSSGNTRRRRAAGSGAGASTTSTARGRCSPACAKSASRWIAATSAGRPNGCEAVQKPDGSWGESCDTYDKPSLKGQGHSTASQTAWGAMGLMAVAGPADPAVRKAIQWLIDRQGARRQLGRTLVHRHRLPARLLPQVSPLPPLFPAHGPLALSSHADSRVGAVAVGVMSYE